VRSIARHTALGLIALGTASVATAAEKAPAAPPTPPVAVLPADLANRLDAADKLVEVMHLDKQLEAVLPQFINLMFGALVPGNGGHEEQIRQILGEELNASFQRKQPEMMALYRQIYAKNFTLEELLALKAFYGSPVGQSLLAKTSKLTQDSMAEGAAIGQKAAMDALPRVYARMQAAQLAVPKGT
jgi:hypothetical protein